MTHLFTSFASDSCSSFLGFPTWYEYVHPAGNCSVVQITSLSDIWLIVAAVIEILLRVAALVAIGFMIVSGFQFLTSEGDPDKAARARTTAISALVGLAIAILSAALINFIAGSIH